MQMKISARVFLVILFVVASHSGCVSNEVKDKNNPTMPYGIPRVITLDATSITMTSAELNSSFSVYETQNVSDRGFCWSSLHIPLITDTLIKISTGLSAIAEGLKPGRNYSFRAYVASSNGYIFGETKSFTTLPTYQVVYTSFATNVKDSSTNIGGNVISEGLTSVTERGIYWSVSPDPENTGSKIQIGSGAGTYSTILTKLIPEKSYFIKAYAVSSIKTVYGDEVKFMTRIGTLTDIDGNKYYIQRIGTHLWMANNLRTTKYADGKPIPEVSSTADWKALTSSDIGYCWYPTVPDYAYKYGLLYTWSAAMNGSTGSTTNIVQGVCPTGWHLPNLSEWLELINFLGGINIAGGKMKEADITYWKNPNTGATNESGFSGLPGGMRNYDGSFEVLDGSHGYWWSTTESEVTWNSCSGVSLNYSNGYANVVSDISKTGHSVRCLKDN
jgi:uncharacterized protein (TIGR02145 family)